MVGCIHFLFKHYNGFLIFHFPIFRPPKSFFRRVISDENFILGFFLEGKGYTIESAWQSLYFSTNGWNTIQLSGMFWYFFPESFFRPVLTKKAETLFFFETDSTFTIAKCAFQRRRFSNVSAGSLGFLLTCMGKVVNDRDWYFWQPIFLPPSFWRKQLKTQFFREQVLPCCLSFLQRASVTLLPFFGLLSHIWHPKACKAMKHKLQLVFSRTFCFFHKILAENYSGENDFSIKKFSFI